MKLALLLVVVVPMLGACASANDSNKPLPAHEVVSGAGRIHGGGMRMDVSVGHPFSQRSLKGNKIVVKQGVVTP
jgi:opacity protein-like surface antigen